MTVIPKGPNLLFCLFHASNGTGNIFSQMNILAIETNLTGLLSISNYHSYVNQVSGFYIEISKYAIVRLLWLLFDT